MTSLLRTLEDHLAAFRRDAVDLIDEASLARKLQRALAEGRGLRVKLGLDPSSPDLHVGHAVQLVKLRDLQELGHTVVLLVGDTTAMVGDPSGKSELRPQLSREEVSANMRTYTEQARLVLDLERAELRYNSEWFGRMGCDELLRLCSRATVAQLLQRDSFQKRMAAEEPVGVHELLYPLMQGWDSVELGADVELGGTDQLFNLMVGRDLQGQVGKEPQVVLTLPLLTGLDGRKMSKSYGNAIGLTDPPQEIFGKTMSIPDEEVPRWLRLLLRLPEEELERVRAGHPRDAKARLAEELVALLHGPAAGAQARASFQRQFVQREVPEDVPERTYAGSWPVPLSVLLREVELAASGAEARRLIEQGGVRVDGEVVRDPTTSVERPRGSLLVQVGRRRFARVRG